MNKQTSQLREGPDVIEEGNAPTILWSYPTQHLQNYLYSVAQAEQAIRQILPSVEQAIQVPLLADTWCSNIQLHVSSLQTALDSCVALLRQKDLPIVIFATHLDYQVKLTGASTQAREICCILNSLTSTSHEQRHLKQQVLVPVTELIKTTQEGLALGPRWQQDVTRMHAQLFGERLPSPREAKERAKLFFSNNK
jgi:hypothetical protein